MARATPLCFARPVPRRKELALGNRRGREGTSEGNYLRFACSTSHQFVGPAALKANHDETGSRTIRRAYVPATPSRSQPRLPVFSAPPDPVAAHGDRLPRRGTASPPGLRSYRPDAPVPESAKAAECGFSGTGTRVRRDLYLHGTQRAVGMLVTRPNFPSAGLAARCADTDDAMERALALRDPQASPSLVERLSRDADASVPTAAACDPRLPVPKLIELSTTRWPCDSGQPGVACGGDAGPARAGGGARVAGPMTQAPIRKIRSYVPSTAHIRCRLCWVTLSRTGLGRAKFRLPSCPPHPECELVGSEAIPSMAWTPSRLRRQSKGLPGLHAGAKVVLFAGKDLAAAAAQLTVRSRSCQGPEV